MSSWESFSSRQSAEKTEKETKTLSTRTSNRDLNHYKSTGCESGLYNILQQEQEVHALQKALNLPQTKAYSTTLAYTNQPTFYNSASISLPAQTTTETNGNNELSLSQSIPHPQDHNTTKSFHPQFIPHSFPLASFSESLDTCPQHKKDYVEDLKTKDISINQNSNLHGNHVLDNVGLEIGSKNNAAFQEGRVQNPTTSHYINGDVHSGLQSNDVLNHPRTEGNKFSIRSINFPRNYQADSTDVLAETYGYERSNSFKSDLINPPIVNIDDLLDASSKLTRRDMVQPQHVYSDRHSIKPLPVYDGHLNESLTLQKSDLTNPRKHLTDTCYSFSPARLLHDDKPPDPSNLNFHKIDSITRQTTHLDTRHLNESLTSHKSDFMNQTITDNHNHDGFVIPSKTHVDGQHYYNKGLNLHDNLPVDYPRRQVSWTPNESSKINGSLHSRIHGNHQSYGSDSVQKDDLVNHPFRSSIVYDNGVYDTRRSSSGERHLLGQVKEAYKVIEHQSQTIARSDKIISELDNQLKTMSMEQEANLQEIQTLRLELDSTEIIKTEGTKKREALQARVNQLDQDFKELSVSHNALLVECKKREGDFLQTDMKLHALESYNNNLRQANSRMQKECEMAKQQMNEVLAENKRIQQESQQARGETAQAMQEQKRIALENASLHSASSEINKQLTNARTGNAQLRQELEKLQMEYNVKCNRVSLLEEEVKQQQETLTVLQHELEQSFQREARKTAVDNSAILNMSLRKRNHLTKGREGDETSQLNEQLLLAKSELARLLNKNKSLKEKLDYSKHVKSQLEEEVKEITTENETLFAEITKYKQLEQQSHKVQHLQEELDKIKGKLSGLEKEKCALVSELHEFQQDKASWEKEKGELIMSVAEMEAENNELKQKLTTESEKISDSVTEDIHAIKQELDDVHKMLRLKDEELMNQCETIEEKQKMLNKLTEEATELKKGFADISSRTTTRNLVISSLGKQLEERDKKIEDLEDELSDKNTQFEELCSRHTKLEEELSRSSSEALQWITADKKKLEEQRDMLRNQVLDLQHRLNKESSHYDPMLLGNDEQLETLRAENTALVSRLESLVHERDSVLQDSEDLMEGMQQLKEAFEDEITRRLEMEREKYVSQQDSLIEEHKNLVMEYANLKEQHKEHIEGKKKLELHCKNLEFERDELRKQVNELCENAARNEDKSTQTDQTSPNPRRRDRGRKRSQSIGAIIPISSLDIEDSNSSPEQRSPGAESPRRYKSQS